MTQSTNTDTRGHVGPSNLHPKFLDIIENDWASKDNPTRVGYFIRHSAITGRLNPGKYFVLTDGNGKFWEVSTKNEKLKIIGNLLTDHDRIKGELRKLKKAYGNCNLCFGEGYATIIESNAWSDTAQDIGNGGSGRYNRLTTKFCKCKRGEQLERLLNRYMEQAVMEARIEENESLLDVAEYEVSLPDRCYMHEKYVSQCYGCRRRKWYSEISKDWEHIINKRVTELKSSK